MKRLLLILGILFACALPAHAATISYAPSAAGSNNGSSCANAYAWTDATNGLNHAAQYLAGNTLELCAGTYPCSAAGATGFTIQASGSSGSPITIKLDSGANMSCSTYWGGDPFSGGPAAIVCNGKSYITITGTGQIENPNNGTAGTSQGKSTGIYVSSCPHFTLSGSLTIGPIYVHTLGDTFSGGAAVWIQDSDNISVSGATMDNAFVPLNIGYDGANSITNAQVFNNVIDHGCHLFVLGDGTANSTASGISIYGNTIGPHNQEWEDATADCHQDGFFPQAGNAGSSITGLYFYDNVLLTDMCSNRSYSGNNCTSPLFMDGTINSSYIFNNIIKYTTTTGGVEGMIRFITTAANQTNDAVYNNTFDMNGAGGGSGNSCTCADIKYDQQGLSQTGMIIENNIFLGGDNFHAPINADDGTFSTRMTTVDHNLFDSSTNPNVAYQSSTGTTYTFPTWQTAGWDAHGASASPGLNASYVPQSGSAAIGLGANLTSSCTASLLGLCNDQATYGRMSSGPWTSGALTFPVLAFPGAEGAGSYALGGRAGSVIHVTNTNDSGTGSFRACATASGARTCVFDTGGTIELQSDLVVTTPFLTVAGQTAPGGGIQIRWLTQPDTTNHYPFLVQTHDVVLRGVRFRPGADTTCCGEAGQADVNAQNVIFDHNDFEWASDQNLNTYYNGTGITYSWNLVAEPLNLAKNGTSHGYGVLLGDGGTDDNGACMSTTGSPAATVNLGCNNQPTSIIKNLFSQNVERNPRIETGPVDVVNNVVYTNNSGAYDGWGIYFDDDTGNGLLIGLNVQSNYLKLGPSATNQTGEYYVNACCGVTRAQVYIDAGNTESGYSHGIQNPNSTAFNGAKLVMTGAAPTVLSAATAYADITSLTASGAGASFQVGCDGTVSANYDSADTRIINDVLGNSTTSPTLGGQVASTIGTPSVVTWPTLAAGSACTWNANNLPTTWVSRYSLGSVTASQTDTVTGYTYLEDYLDGLVPAGAGTTSSGPCSACFVDNRP